MNRQVSLIIIGNCALIALTAILSTVASAQQPPVSIIECEEKGVVEVRPDYFEIHLKFKFDGEFFVDAFSKVLNLEENLRANLAELKLIPAGLEFSGIQLAKSDLSEYAIYVTACLRIDLAGIIDAEEGPRACAALYDNIKKLVAKLGCELVVLKPAVIDTADIELAAVVKATENAYPIAEALAVSVDAEITALDKVTVLSIEWNTSSAINKRELEIPELQCMAKVKVAYAFASSQP